MLHIRSIPLLFSWLLFFPLSLQCQTDSLELQLRPLDDLLTDALVHSPVLQLNSIDADIIRSEMEVLRKEWSNYVSLSASASVGNLQVIENVAARDFNTFFLAGVNLRLPLSDFLTKGDRREQLELELEKNRVMQQQRTLEVRELVIRQYNDLQRALRVLSIRNRDLNFHELATENAERYFREGSIDLEEYTSVFNKRNEAEVRLEEAKLDAQLYYLLLQELVGTNIDA